MRRWLGGAGVVAASLALVPTAHAVNVAGTTFIVGASPVNVTEEAFVAQGCDDSVTPADGVDGVVVDVGPGGAARAARVDYLTTVGAHLSIVFYTNECTKLDVEDTLVDGGDVTFLVPPTTRWLIVRAHDGPVLLGPVTVS
jgi:hypothetical protein